MMTFNPIRIIFRTLTRQSILLKNTFSIVNHRIAFVHSSKILWSTHPIEIKMPSLSPTMTEGTIVKWIKKEGDPIEPGDVLCEIQTDKAVVGLETEEEGVLEKILIPEDTKNIQLGEIIAIIRAEGEATEIQAAPEQMRSAETVSTPTKSDVIKLLGPSVKKLLEEYCIKSSDIVSTGPRENLLKGDVLQYIKAHDLKIVAKVTDKPKKTDRIKPKGAHTDIPVTSSTIAQQMIQSKQTIPHGYMSTNCKVDKIFDYQKKFEKDGIHLTLNEFLVKSATLALKRVPKLKSVRQGSQLKMIDAINIFITNFIEGNIEMSIIENAENLTIQSISEQLKANVTNQNTINNAFRILNLSQFEISEYTEVISPTNVAVLAIGGIQCSFEHNKPVKKLKVTLSFDNYIVDETEACEFLETFKQYLENPLIAV